MKKVIIGTALYMMALLAISVCNDLVLLNLHDFSYYYTWEGIRLAAIVVSVEAVVIVPFTKLFFVKYLRGGQLEKILEDEEES